MSSSLANVCFWHKADVAAMLGDVRFRGYWKLRKAGEVARECETLKTRLALLHTELENKQHAVGRLELLIRQRNETIDNLNDKLAQSREQCRRLDEEADRLANLFQTWRDWWTPAKN